MKPDFAGVRRVGVFGGSFDPVHMGHLHVARSAAEAFDLERIVFVPAARPPHKPGVNLAGGAARLDMLRIALADEASWSTCDLELGREGPSFTIDTLRELPRRLALERGARLFLLIGSDNLRGFPTWRQAEELLEIAEPIIVHRGEDLAPVWAELQRDLPSRAFERLRSALLTPEPVRISASELRARLARGEGPGEQLPPGVLEYIRARGIYAPQP
jgi:nicotinate-nucleotide adenylyltransferase